MRGEPCNGLRIADRERLEEHDVNNVEGGYVDSDSQGKDCNRGERHSPRFTQHPQAKADILESAVQPTPSPGVMRFFQHECGVAKAPAVVAQHFSVDFHVIAELTFKAAPVEQIVDAPKKFTHRLFSILAILTAGQSSDLRGSRGAPADNSRPWPP